MLHLVSGTNSRILFVKLVLRDKQEFLCVHYINFCEREMNKKGRKNAYTVVNCFSGQLVNLIAPDVRF